MFSMVIHLPVETSSKCRVPRTPYCGVLPQCTISTVMNKIAITAFSSCKHCVTVYTVEPPKKGHFGANSFVPSREVVPISEVK